MSSEKEAALSLLKLGMRLFADSNSWNVNGKLQDCEADQARLQVKSVSVTGVQHPIYTVWHWVQLLDFASLKLPFALTLAGNIVALLRW